MPQQTEERHSRLSRPHSKCSFLNFTKVYGHGCVFQGLSWWALQSEGPQTLNLPVSLCIPQALTTQMLSGSMKELPNSRFSFLLVWLVFVLMLKVEARTSHILLSCTTTPWFWLWFWLWWKRQMCLVKNQRAKSTMHLTQESWFQGQRCQEASPMIDIHS